MLAPDEIRRRATAALSPEGAVLEAYLFGSVASGDAAPHSDIEIAVYLDPDATPDAPWGYDAELISLLMGALETNAIDPVVLNQAPPLLYGNVLRFGERLLSRDLQATTVREGQALSRYCDYLPQLAKIRAAFSVGKVLGRPATEPPTSDHP